jgi:1-deoxy-D-xylulose-5-phosphate synthase
MVLMAPSDEAELNRCLRFALTLETGAALRYPRDSVPSQDFEKIIPENLRSAAATEWQLGISRTLREGTDATLLAYGAMVEHAMLAAEALCTEGINVEVIDARFCKPLDEAMLVKILRTGHPVLTVEDHSLQNGFGTAVAEHAVSHYLPTRWITRLGMPDRLIAHATRPQQLAEVGLDASGIAASVRDAIRRAKVSSRNRADQPGEQIESTR